MKLKNVVVGSEIEAKHDTKFFTEGEVVKVLYKEDSDCEDSSTLKLENSKGEKLWSNHKYFRRPRPKKLDQSVLDGLDEKWRFAATDRDGKAFLFSRKPTANNTEWYAESIADYEIIGTGYDASNWKNSLIERESKELTGSDLCRAMLERGDRHVMCAVSMADDETALNEETVTLNRIVISLDKEWLYTDTGTRWHYAVPINNQGEPLTAKDVGL